jgi:hypothetical protein
LTDQGRDFDFPEFNNLTRISYESGEGGPSSPVFKFIDRNSASLHSVKLHNCLWRFLSSPIAIHNIRHLDLLGSFDTRVFHDVLSDGGQLEFLSLNCKLHCAPSSIFKTYCSSLPSLKHFSFSVSDALVRDEDLFPALMAFVQKRTLLKTLRLVVEKSDVMQRVGFNASVWGVLPTLVNLTSLAISHLKEFPLSLAPWLIPKGTRVMILSGLEGDTLQVGSDTNPVHHLITYSMQSLESGLPATLHFVHLVGQVRGRISLRRFPELRLFGVNHDFFTVKRGVKDATIERWPTSGIRYYAADWLEWLGCEDAITADLLWVDVWCATA